MGGLGAPELIIILLVLVLLFGSSKLPKLAKALGEASKEFKKGIDTPGADTHNPGAASSEPDHT
jgi:sec-independent protein translocase protein TatA